MVEVAEELTVVVAVEEATEELMGVAVAELMVVAAVEGATEELMVAAVAQDTAAAAVPVMQEQEVITAALAAVTELLQEVVGTNLPTWALVFRKSTLRILNLFRSRRTSTLSTPMLRDEASKKRMNGELPRILLSVGQMYRSRS